MHRIVMFVLAVVFVGSLNQVAECQMRTRTNDSKLLEKFDGDKNGWLNTDERTLARKFHEDQKKRRGRDIEEGAPITPDEVKNYAGVALYDQSVLRTLFIEF